MPTVLHRTQPFISHAWQWSSRESWSFGLGDIKRCTIWLSLSMGFSAVSVIGSGWDWGSDWLWLAWTFVLAGFHVSWLKQWSTSKNWDNELMTDIHCKSNINITSLVHSRIDSTNSIVYSFFWHQKLQRLQNTAARIVLLHLSQLPKYISLWTALVTCPLLESHRLCHY